ncbi:hypothetical protein ACFL4N_01755 [Thermodesulfobacteriota bacterium]
MVKYSLLTIVSLFVIASSTMSYAHVDSLEIKVLDFQTHETGEHTIVFEAIDSRANGKSVERKKRKYSVHISYVPKNLALSVTKQEHDAAIKYLQALLLKNKHITILRMSGQGYRPIENRKGHYRADALKLVTFLRNQQNLMFVHSDDSFFATH